MIRVKTLLLLIILLSGSIFLSASDFQRALAHFCSDSTIEPDSLYSLLNSFVPYQQPEELEVLLKESHVINDTIHAPFYYYLPSGYESGKKTPLLIYLHGGVSRSEFLEEYGERLQDNPFLLAAAARNWISLFPLGNFHTAWWTETGINNIKYQIRFLKEYYNIDDDRIFLTGFSDGGSAAFHFSLLSPEDFAAFYPLSGNMLVGSAVTGIPVYPRNMSNRYLRAVNTDLDGLYPAEKMRLMIATAQEMDANIFYQEYHGIGHTYEYQETDLPLMFSDMEKQVRNVFQPAVQWEANSISWGRCDWLQIVELDTLQTKQEWHKQQTLLLPEDRILFGFIEDDSYEEYGVRIGSVNEDSVVDEMGLMTGDIIIAMDGDFTETIEELITVRDNKKRGDSFTLTIKRGAEEYILPGQFPPITYQELFAYEEKSGAVRGVFRANSFILETSLVAAIAVYIHPGMINLDLPVKVIINGEELFNDMVDIDREFLTENFRKNRDRSALWVNKIIIDVP
jgi:predicted esterase